MNLPAEVKKRGRPPRTSKSAKTVKSVSPENKGVNKTVNIPEGGDQLRGMRASETGDQLRGMRGLQIRINRSDCFRSSQVEVYTKMENKYFRKICRFKDSKKIFRILETVNSSVLILDKYIRIIDILK